MKQFIFAATILVGTAIVGCESSTMLESQPAAAAEASVLDKAFEPIPSFNGHLHFSEIIDFAAGDIGSSEESETATAFGNIRYSISGSPQDPEVADLSFVLKAKLRPTGSGVIATFSSESSGQVRLPASGEPGAMLEVYHSEGTGDYVLCIEYMVDRHGVSIESVWLGNDILPY